MSKRRKAPPKRADVRMRTLGLVLLLGAVIMAQGRTAISPARPVRPSATNPSGNSAERPGEKAWRILCEGLKDDRADKRAKAARALGLLTGNAEAEKAAVLALKDEKPNVRRAAAHALGAMRHAHGCAPLPDAAAACRGVAAAGAAAAGGAATGDAGPGVPPVAAGVAGASPMDMSGNSSACTTFRP